MNTEIPQQMNAITTREHGEPDVMQLSTATTPIPGANEVLVQVTAAGINRPDVMQRQGMYPPPPGAPDILGLEIAGTVVAIGEEVTELGIGDQVCALVAGGGYAEYCIAASSLCMSIPKGMDMVSAAALPETFFTVWTNVFERGALKSGESLLVHGGTSGIGTTAIQLAKQFGASVYVTAGSAEKCQACIDLGADAAINYKTEDFEERIESLTDAQGVNLILDMVGGDYLPRNLKCLAVEGRLVQIALQRGPKVEMNLLPIMLKRLTITGSTLRPRSIEEKAQIASSLRKQVWPLMDKAVVRPLIHATFPLADAAEAHRMMERSEHIGKIVLTM
ncbi:MAG: NAD(P)H-quinone oxidoreductase [Gammaproteobacteria bacterium]